MPADRAYSVHRAPVEQQHLLGRRRPDYADAFAVELADPDGHPAELWARVALESASPSVRRTIRVAQGHVLRLRLRPASDRDALLGWPVQDRAVDLLHLRAAGPLVEGDVVAGRTSPRRVVVTTSLVFAGRRARLLWRVVGPLHRRIAPYLLRRAAESLTTGAPGR